MAQETTQATTEAVTPRTIPTPPDFPVVWERPEDAGAFWTRDPMHFVSQITPLEGAYLRRFMDIGFRSAAHQHDLPVHFIARRINTHFYQALVPITTDHAALEAIEQRSERTLGAAVGRLGAAWREEYLPEIERYITDWEAFDLAAATMPALIAHLDESIARTTRLMEIHFLIAMPMLLGMSLFDELYTELFGKGDAFAAYQLLQGFDNKTIEADRALWKLGRVAAASDTARRVLEERATADVLPALEATAEGRSFLEALRAYLETYGKRSDTWFLLSETPWIDDPAPVVRNLKDYVTQPDRDPDAEMAALAAAREAALVEIRARLEGYPQAVRDQFEGLLQAAQTGTVLQEDHNFWIDFRSTYEMRRVVTELGRRFVAAGALDAADDVFYLTFDEIRETADSLPQREPRATVAERKGEMAHFAAIPPPFALGTEPPGPPPDNPIGRAIGKFFGGPPQESAEPGVLKGNAGSRGIVRGTAKVIRSLAEAGKLHKGDILVAETTAPPWTPLFATAAAVVTDTGGILSHCAVVAREYMIPAVVGVGMATHVIQDGMTLEVDGTAGTVRIIG
ncbi:MAG: PEP-utilizing enzyme [Chloroflexota bacterium]|nr:PEP-utilizing enzyme [Chloroflexota bacterium]MDQ6906222.1 PEP-utilizing enzyme [Chloroflexota bacterium]